MRRESSPNIPRWRLGAALCRLREDAGYDMKAAAKELGCSEAKIRRIERGESSIGLGDLRVLLDWYGVEEGEYRRTLLDLQEQSRHHGWWVKHGGVEDTHAQYLGLETSATMIRSYEPLLIHGLLQTESYFRAISAGWSVGPPEDFIDNQWKIRQERQQLILDSDDPPTLWMIVDERALRHVVGSPEVMRAQLQHLRSLARKHTIQVIPADAGAHPGLFGILVIFEFEDDVHAPVVYSSSQLGNLYVDSEKEVTRCRLVFEQLAASALSPTASTRLIGEIAKEMTVLEE
jgi:transcriptional regulator with XRE-family HTH domain